MIQNNLGGQRHGGSRTESWVYYLQLNDSNEGSFTRHELAAPLARKVTRQFTTTRDCASLSNAVPAIPPLLLHRHVISVRMQRPVPCALTLKSSCIIMLQHSRSSSSNSSPLDISSLHSWRRRRERTRFRNHAPQRTRNSSLSTASLPGILLNVGAHSPLSNV